MSASEKRRKDLPRTTSLACLGASNVLIPTYDYQVLAINDVCGVYIGILVLGSSYAGTVRPSTLLSGSATAVFVLFPISPTKIPSVISGARGNCSNNVCEVRGIYKHLVRVERQLRAPDVAALD